VAKVQQLHFEWGAPSVSGEPQQVVLDPQTTELVVALIARAMIAVVGAVEEVDHER